MGRTRKATPCHKNPHLLKPRNTQGSIRVWWSQEQRPWGFWATRLETTTAIIIGLPTAPAILDVLSMDRAFIGLFSIDAVTLAAAITAETQGLEII